MADFLLFIHAFIFKIYNLPPPKSHVLKVKVLQSLPVTILDYLVEFGIKFIIQFPQDSESLTFLL